MHEIQAVKDFSEAARLDPPCAIRLLRPKTDKLSNLRGTIINNTSRPIEGLKLAIKTTKWERTFDLDIQVKIDDSKPFSINLGEIIDIESCQVVRQVSGGIALGR
jgi:hypothetical protein